MPFALTNAAVSDITVTAVKQVYQSPWRGSIQKSDTWVWIDNFCLLVQFNQSSDIIIKLILFCLFFVMVIMIRSRNLKQTFVLHL